MSLILRHKPEAAGLTLDSNGWVEVEILLEACARNGNALSREELEETVATNDKKRFAFDESRKKIRANQGHSIKVEIGFEEKIPPPVLYHGTAEKNLDLILETGLKKMKRHHVHLSSDMETARRVGNRYGKPVVLQIDAARMARQNYKFYISANEVWLTDQVPSQFLKVL